MQKSRWSEYAIVIGLGLVIAMGITLFLYWRDDSTPGTTPTPTPAASAPPVTQLPDKQAAPIEFLVPEDQSVFEQKALTVTGHTFPDSPVVIFMGEKDFLVYSDATGAFSLDLNLDSGANQLTATVVTPDGESFSDSRLVVYTNKSLEEILLTEQELLEADQQQPTP
ncbi:hypothetical protein IJJ12_00745 [bacterium]|nr:hypothetical protein [bacterium]